MKFLFYLGLFIVTASFAAAITCGSNENEVECLQNCTFDSCPTSQDETNVCTNNTGSDCQPGCKCDVNYRRAENGTCIPTTDCPPFACPGQNEYYHRCPPDCTDDYDSISCNGTCKNTTLNTPNECVPKCRCQNGYARNIIKTCTLIADCFSEGIQIPPI